VYTIAIQPDDQLLTSGRRQSFSTRWVELARRDGHEARLVNAFDETLFDQLAGCDGFMWWFAHLPRPRNFGKRLLPAVEHGLGIPVFPAWPTVWHFDDKVAQHYLLQAAGIPTPRTWVFWREQDAHAFCRRAQYPLVIKLASGIIADNVRLLRGADEADHWVDRLFGAGVVTLEWPRPPAHRRLLARLRSAARLALTGRPPVMGTVLNDVQRGYFLVQEFLPGNEFDLRAAIIGNRAFAFRRFNRPNDFRASGSGLRDPDPAKIDVDSVRLALRVAERLGTKQSLAVDVLRRGADGERVITEVSYYYEGWILHEECPGHWVLHGDADTGRIEWVDRRVRPEDAIWEDFMAGLEARRTGAAARAPALGPGVGAHAPRL
jgi:hypothetical protein